MVALNTQLLNLKTQEPFLIHPASPTRKEKRQIISIVGEGAANWNLRMLLVGTWNGKQFRSFIKSSPYTYQRSQQFSPLSLPVRKHVHKDLHVNIHQIVIPNSPKLETNPKPTAWRMDKQKVVHLLLQCNKEAQSANTCNNMDASQEHCTMWKKPHRKHYKLYDSMSVQYL